VYSETTNLCDVKELFHGSNQTVVFPDSHHIEDGDVIRAHHRDFGMGFYLHFDRNGADEWAGVVIAIKRAGKPTINRYSFKYRSDLLIYSFDKNNEKDLYDWLDYVLWNRGYTELTPRNPLGTKEYDIVIGPIANNEYGKSIQLLTDGDIPGDTLEEQKRNFIKGNFLLIDRLGEQLCFKTKKAERTLQLI
jgi:hypothetical protein